MEERCHLHLPESTHNECLNQKRGKHEIARTLGMGEGKRIIHYWKNPYVNIPEETKINHHVKCIIQYDEWELQCDYYNHGHLDKVDQSDYRKVTVHSEKASYQS